MKVAIFTPGGSFSGAGGGERAELDLAEALDADVISITHFEKELMEYFESQANVISLEKRLPKTQPLSTLAAIRLFKKIDFRDSYDFFIGSSLSMYALKKHKPHLLYCFTPLRELYDMHYIVLENQRNRLRRIMVNVWCDAFRFFDRRFVKKYIDNIACISHTARNRVYKAYQRDAEVIYLPVRVEQYTYRPSEGYWLSVNRLHPWKRVELQIETFRKMPDKELYVVGEITGTPYVRRLLKMAPKNVKFVGRAPNQEVLRDLYSRCEGHITTAIDEDFGLTPVEAMASGKPVVAVKEGGYLETVLDGITGRLVSPRVDELVEAVREISKNPESYKEDCIKRAKLFDYSVFKKRINALVKEIYDDYESRKPST